MPGSKQMTTNGRGVYYLACCRSGMTLIFHVSVITKADSFVGGITHPLSEWLGWRKWAWSVRKNTESGSFYRRNGGREECRNGAKR